MVQLPIIDETHLARGSEPQTSMLDADAHLVETELGTYLLVANGTRIYRLTDETTAEFRASRYVGEANAVKKFLAKHGLDAAPYIDDQAPKSFPVRALSLAVAQKCNLGCTYCYAEGGSFGSIAKNMTRDVALAAVDRLLENAASGDRVNLAFLGGEPLINRPVLRAATVAAAERAERKGVVIGFAITTNGSLLTQDDAEFFEQHGFAVTISLDGVGATHDRLRPYKSGRGSYFAVMQRVEPLLNRQQRMQVSARVTVTPRNLELRRTLDEFISIGFHSVGFSPMLSSPTGCDEMAADELDVMLQQMKECGREFERNMTNGCRYPFANMVNALKEIHRGTHRPYPCGAGAGYFGVSADGNLFACHRFVDDPVGGMGSVTEGVDQDRQTHWLAERHVHSQEPCSVCWARYLCGGGCHHEVIRRGRPACDYIRGWLDYCLQAYVRVLNAVPAYFGDYSGDENSK